MKRLATEPVDVVVGVVVFLFGIAVVIAYSGVLVGSLLMALGLVLIINGVRQKKTVYQKAFPKES